MIFTMCPVAATQRMFSGCGDRVTIAPSLREDIPTAWVLQLTRTRAVLTHRHPSHC